MSKGSLFHRCGTALINAPESYVVLHKCSCNLFCSADLKLRTDVWGLSRELKYSGPVPCRPLNVWTYTLNTILSATESQCSCLTIGVICSKRLYHVQNVIKLQQNLIKFQVFCYKNCHNTIMSICINSCINCINQESLHFVI